MSTFSQIVDEIVLETRRPDLRLTIANYLNQTVREIHADPVTNSVAFYDANYAESQVVITGLSGQTWVVPNLSLFQGEVAVRFDNVFDRSGRRVYARRVQPGPNIELQDYYYYRAADTFVFGGVAGYGAIGSTISIAYYQYPKSLKYYAVADRPATYDVEEGWAYHEDYDSTDELKESAREKVSNWVLLRWKECMMEGLRAKIYKRLSDDVRQRTSYSLFGQMKRQLYTSEVANVTNQF